MTKLHYDPNSNRLLAHYNSHLPTHEKMTGYCHNCGLICHPTSWHWRERSTSTPLLNLCDDCTAEADAWKWCSGTKTTAPYAYGSTPISIADNEPALSITRYSMRARNSDLTEVHHDGPGVLYANMTLPQGVIDQAHPPASLTLMRAIAPGRDASTPPPTTGQWPPSYEHAPDITTNPGQINPLILHIIAVGMIVSVMGQPMTGRALSQSLRVPQHVIDDALNEASSQGWISTCSDRTKTMQPEWFLTTLGFAVGEWYNVQENTIAL